MSQIQTSKWYIDREDGIQGPYPTLWEAVADAKGEDEYTGPALERNCPGDYWLGHINIFKGSTLPEQAMDGYTMIPSGY